MCILVLFESLIWSFKKPTTISTITAVHFVRIQATLFHVAALQLGGSEFGKSMLWEHDSADDTFLNDLAMNKWIKTGDFP